MGNNSYLCIASSWVHSDLKQTPRATKDNLFPSSHWPVSLGSVTDDSVDQALKAKNSRNLTLLSSSLDHKPPQSEQTPYSSTLGEKTIGIRTSQLRELAHLGPTCFCLHISTGLKDTHTCPSNSSCYLDICDIVFNSLHKLSQSIINFTKEEPSLISILPISL